MQGRYAAGEESSEEGGTKPKAFVSLNWVLEEQPLDLETQLAWGFLDYLLLGTSAAPLRKALNDSSLGEALIGGGLMDELRQPVFSIGLKGVNPPDAAKVWGPQHGALLMPTVMPAACRQPQSPACTHVHVHSHAPRSGPCLQHLLLERRRVSQHAPMCWWHAG